MKEILLNKCPDGLDQYTSSLKKYSDFDEFVLGKKRVDIIFDTIFLSDLDGSDIGFNEQKNAFALELLKDTVETSLLELGYEPNVVFSGNGVFYEPKDNVNYFYSQDWASTGQVFVPVVQQSSSTGWQSPETHQYFQSLISIAEEEEDLRKKSKRQESKPQIKQSNVIPTNLASDLSSDILLYISAQGFMKSTSKKIAQGVLIGAASGILTGGTLILGPPTDHNHLKIIAVDRSSNRVVWYQDRASGGYKSVSIAALTSLGYFPLVEGRFLKREERAEWKKRVGLKLSKIKESK